MTQHQKEYISKNPKGLVVGFVFLAGIIITITVVSAAASQSAFGQNLTATNSTLTTNNNATTTINATIAGNATGSLSSFDANNHTWRAELAAQDPEYAKFENFFAACYTALETNGLMGIPAPEDCLMAFQQTADRYCGFEAFDPEKCQYVESIKRTYEIKMMGAMGGWERIGWALRINEYIVMASGMAFFFAGKADPISIIINVAASGVVLWNITIYSKGRITNIHLLTCLLSLLLRRSRVISLNDL